RRDHVACKAHVRHTSDGSAGGVCVDGAEHQVTSEGRTHGDLECLLVSHFADHHDVRVLTQDTSQGGGESHADVRTHLHLVDAGKLILNRVFHGDDVDFGRIDVLQEAVQRCGFA